MNRRMAGPSRVPAIRFKLGELTKLDYLTI